MKLRGLNRTKRAVRRDPDRKTPPDPASTVVEFVNPPGEPLSSRMTMRQLTANYRAIVRANAIFYPVAFHFERELGRGRQGVVFLSLRQGARGCITEHAIKLFDPALYRNPEEYWTDMGRIALQISRLQRLQSPNLVGRHSYEETHGIGYTQMEAIDGMDLQSLLKGDHFDLARRQSTDEEWAAFSNTLFDTGGSNVSLKPGFVVYILRNILRGLERLHDMGFLHSDIKPGNIMIDRLGTIKIIDFGRAVLVNEQLSFLLGSPLYMAPEIHMRKPGNLQSDFFSLGLVGIEMLRGQRVADEGVTEEELLKIKLNLPNRLSEILPKAVLDNEYLVSILSKFIDPDPDNRHTSAKEAESGNDSLKEVDKQFMQAGMDTEYARTLSDYMAKLVDRRTDRIEDAVE